MALPASSSEGFRGVTTSTPELITHGVTLRPGSLTIICGPPASGKTTLARAIEHDARSAGHASAVSTVAGVIDWPKTEPGQLAVAIVDPETWSTFNGSVEIAAEGLKHHAMDEGFAAVLTVQTNPHIGRVGSWTADWARIADAVFWVESVDGLALATVTRDRRGTPSTQPTLVRRVLAEVTQ